MTMLYFLLLNIYFANLHCHTSISDGEGRVEEAFIYARDTARIDILVLTDHSHMMKPETYINARRIAERFRDGFIGIFGQEFGSLNDFGFGHIGILNSESLLTVDKYSIEFTYRYMDEKGLIGNFHHPFEGDFEDFKYYPYADDNIPLLEIINKDHIFEDRFIEALNKGWHVSPTANQDNHNKGWGDEECGGRIPLTGVVMDELTYDEFFESLKNRRTYAFQESPEGDRIYLDFKVDGIEMGGIKERVPGVITIEGSLRAVTPFDTIYIFKNGEIVKRLYAGVNRFEFTVEDSFYESSYYFLKAVQKDGDLLYSAPVWLNFSPLSGNRIRVIPNPAHEFCRFKLDEEVYNPSLYIYDVRGRVIYRGSQLEWGLKDSRGRKVREGIYFVIVEATDRYGRIRRWRDKVWVRY